jgi:hypothetical protein
MVFVHLPPKNAPIVASGTTEEVTMSRLSRGVLVVLLLAAAGCSSDPVRWGPDPTPLAASAQVRTGIGEGFRLAPGEFAAIADRNFLVAFRGVQSDSRCPRDVTCVWPGDAEVVVGIAFEHTDWTWSVLHTGVEPRRVEVEGLIVTVVDVEPQPLSTATIADRDYRAVLTVGLE